MGCFLLALLCPEGRNFECKVPSLHLVFTFWRNVRSLVVTMNCEIIILNEFHVAALHLPHTRGRSIWGYEGFAYFLLFHFVTVVLRAPFHFYGVVADLRRRGELPVSFDRHATQAIRFESQWHAFSLSFLCSWIQELQFVKAASLSAGMCSPTSIQMDSYLRILLLPVFCFQLFSLPHHTILVAWLCILGW